MSHPSRSGASELVEHTTTRRSFDVWNEVPLVAQSTGMSCWAAAAAMLIGWRESLVVDPDDVARGAGRWSEFKNGLHPEDVAGFAARWGLVAEHHDDVWEIDRFRGLLEQFGPLWVGEASPGLHAIVVTGLHGDGTPEGTHVRVNDPWPVGAGERYTISYRKLRENFDEASRLTGDRAHILHSGGRGGGNFGISRAEERFSSRFHRSHKIGDTMNRYGRGAVLDAAESLEVRAGDRYLNTTRVSPDPLAGHGGTGDNLYLTWNAIPDGATTVDVVVHLHGYSSAEPNRAMLEGRVARSGLDLAGRSRPTLAIVPRGRKITAAEIAAETQPGRRPPNPERYTFPALGAQSGAGLERLIQYALAAFCRDVLGGRTVARGRLIFTAHSGGGAAVEALVRHRSATAACNPHEVHLFDALYSASPEIAAWAGERIRADQTLVGQPNSEAALARDGGGCRIIYRSGTSTNSVEVARALPSSGPLRTSYRAESTTVGHDDVPRVFGRALFTSVRADLVVVPARARGQSFVQPLDFDGAVAFAIDDDARAWLTADQAARGPLEAGVRTWIGALDRSAIELLPDVNQRRHFLTAVNWQHQNFPKPGRSETAEAEALFNAMERVVSERRANSTSTRIAYHNVDGVVVYVPGNGSQKLFPEAKDAYVRMRDAARADGVTLTILSAFRSAATQERIKSGSRNPAAVAQGVSSHTYGLAIDLAMTVPNLTITEIRTGSMPNIVTMYRSPVYKWMALNGRRFGWFPYRREPWHWEYNPEGFKARFESHGRHGGGVSYGAPTGLFDHYAPSDADTTSDRLVEAQATQWEDALVRAIYAGERRVNRLMKVARDAGGPNDATVRPGVLKLLKIPFPRRAQAGGVSCEQHVRKLADPKPDTPRVIFTGRYEARMGSGGHSFWAINQAGTAVLVARTRRTRGPHINEYWILRGDVQEDGTAVLFQIDKPDQMWGYLEQQPDRSFKWYHGSYRGPDGKRVVVDDKPGRDEVLQFSADNRPTMMESLYKSDDEYLSVLLQQREWYPLTKAKYEFLRDSAGSDLLEDLLTDYLKLPKGRTGEERDRKQTAAGFVVNYIGHMLWDGTPAMEPHVLDLQPRLKAFAERSRQFIPHGHYTNPILARHVAKLWLAHAKLNHAGEKRSFLDCLTTLVHERRDSMLSRLLDVPLTPSRSAGTHRYHLKLEVATFGFVVGYAEGYLTVEKLTDPKWPGPVTFDVAAGTLGKPKLPSRDEVFDLTVTVDEEWGVDDFEGSLWLGEVTVSAGVKGVTGGATVIGGYLRSENGLSMPFEDAEPFIKSGGSGGKQGKPKFKVRAEGMFGRVRRRNNAIIDLSKVYVANPTVAGDLTSAAHFCFGSALLTPAARQLLRVVCADQLAALASPASKVYIVGHADRAGTIARNQELSEMRAKNVRTALKDILGPALKVPDSAIHDIGIGEFEAMLIRQRPDEVKNPADRRVDLWVNANLVATFRE